MLVFGSVSNGIVCWWIGFFLPQWWLDILDEDVVCQSLRVFFGSVNSSPQWGWPAHQKILNEGKSKDRKWNTNTQKTANQTNIKNHVPTCPLHHCFKKLSAKTLQKKTCGFCWKLLTFAEFWFESRWLTPRNSEDDLLDVGFWLAPWGWIIPRNPKVHNGMT